MQAKAKNLGCFYLLHSPSPQGFKPAATPLSHCCIFLSPGPVLEDKRWSSQIFVRLSEARPNSESILSQSKCHKAHAPWSLHLQDQDQHSGEMDLHET